MVRGPPASGEIDGIETQAAQIKGFDEGIDHSHWIVFVDVVLQPIREQKPLRTIDSIEKSLHEENESTGAEILPAEVLSHSLDS